MLWGPCQHADSRGMFLCARNTWWASEAHTSRRRRWGLRDKGSSLTKSVISLVGARLGASEFAWGLPRLCTLLHRPTPRKGPRGAWSDSGERCEWWGHSASTSCWSRGPTLLPCPLPSGRLCCEDLGPLPHSILSLGGVHGKKAGSGPSSSPQPACPTEPAVAGGG